MCLVHLELLVTGVSIFCGLCYSFLFLMSHILMTGISFYEFPHFMYSSFTQTGNGRER